MAQTTRLQQGTVRRWWRSSGMGFIDNPEGDVLVHHSVIEGQGVGRKNLHVGQMVEYTAKRGSRGLSATMARVVEGGN